MSDNILWLVAACGVVTVNRQTSTQRQIDSQTHTENTDRLTDTDRRTELQKKTEKTDRLTAMTFLAYGPEYLALTIPFIRVTLQPLPLLYNILL